MQQQLQRVGLIALTDPRQNVRSLSRERHIHKAHNELVQTLRNSGAAVSDPMPQIRKAWTDAFGIFNAQDIQACLQHLNGGDIDCLIIETYGSSDISLVVNLARRLKVPIALYTGEDGAWDASSFALAASAAMSEDRNLPHSATHSRIRSKNALLSWIKGVSALAATKRAAILLWGTGWGLSADALQEDILSIKGRFVRDILHEEQAALVAQAENILQKRSDQLQVMTNWLKRNGAKIHFDKQKLTPESFSRQTAIYLAARARLEKLEQEANVRACCIKCQPELSEGWGVSACLLPTFLPFPRDAYGQKSEITTNCRCDVKNLVTALLLRQISGDSPALIGMTRSFGGSHVLFGNCGGASAYYAGNSANPAKALPHLEFHPQPLATAGAAAQFSGRVGTMTFARLGCAGGNYRMQIGLGEIQSLRRETRERLKFGGRWPLHAVKFAAAAEHVFEILDGETLAAVPGDVTVELKHACHAANLPVTTFS